MRHGNGIDDPSWNRLLELIRSTQGTLLPSLVRMHEDDDLSLLDGTMLWLLDRGEDLARCGSSPR
ncbi:hypothetical protein [Nonomuraea sp. NPDC050643]|uniref:hypothetical protein n=1 Tax=Nonomuraea sp. NPDC050643 TaxID=3155660 RepID=UPI0033D964B8